MVVLSWPVLLTYWGGTNEVMGLKANAYSYTLHV